MASLFDRHNNNSVISISDDDDDGDDIEDLVEQVRDVLRQNLLPERVIKITQTMIRYGNT